MPWEIWSTLKYFLCFVFYECLATWGFWYPTGGFSTSTSSFEFSTSSIKCLHIGVLKILLLGLIFFLWLYCMYWHPIILQILKSLILTHTIDFLYTLLHAQLPRQLQQIQYITLSSFFHYSFYFYQIFLWQFHTLYKGNHSDYFIFNTHPTLSTSHRFPPFPLSHTNHFSISMPFCFVLWPLL